MDQDSWMEKLKKEGIRNLAVVNLKPNFESGEHTHELLTTHVILEGQLIIQDSKAKTLFIKGDRVDFPAGTKHAAIFGPMGCTMIVGIKS